MWVSSDPCFLQSSKAAAVGHGALVTHGVQFMNKPLKYVIVCGDLWCCMTFLQTITCLFMHESSFQWESNKVLTGHKKVRKLYANNSKIGCKYFLTHSVEQRFRHTGTLSQQTARSCLGYVHFVKVRLYRGYLCA